MAENHHLPLTGGIALTTVYADYILTDVLCNTMNWPTCKGEGKEKCAKQDMGIGRVLTTLSYANESADG